MRLSILLKSGMGDKDTWGNKVINQGLIHEIAYIARDYYVAISVESGIVGRHFKK